MFAERFIKYLRDILMIKITNKPEIFLNTSEENAMKIDELSVEFSKERLLRSIDLMVAAYAATRASSFSRTTYEMALVKMCEPDTEDTALALRDRIAVLEEKLSKGEFTVVAADDLPWKEDAPKPEKPKPEKAEVPKDTPKPKKEENPEPAPAPATDGAVAGRWPEIINYIKSHGGMPIFPHLSLVHAKEVAGKLCVVFGDNALLSKSVVSKPSNLDLIKSAVKAVTGQDMEVACVTPKEIGETPEDPFKRLEELAKTHSEIQFI